MPHLGAREGVKYTPQTQAAFWEAYLKPGKLATTAGGPWVFHGVAFEAFDLPWKAAEFLIFSDSFPRSLHFCVSQVDDYLRRILGDTAARPRSAAGRASRRLLADLQSLSITDVLNQGLHEFLMETQAALDAIGDEVVQTTMFYPAESILEEQQQQQQQQ